jgi:hypothetical protein
VQASTFLTLQAIASTASSGSALLMGPNAAKPFLHHSPCSSTCTSGSADPLRRTALAASQGLCCCWLCWECRRHRFRHGCGARLRLPSFGPPASRLHADTCAAVIAHHRCIRSSLHLWAEQCRGRHLHRLCGCSSGGRWRVGSCLLLLGLPLRLPPGGLRGLCCAAFGRSRPVCSCACATPQGVTQSHYAITSSKSRQ